MESRTKGLNVVLFGKIKHLSYIIKWKFHVVMIILFFVHDVWTKYLAFSISLSKKKIVHFLPQVHVPQYTMMCKKKKNNTISIKCLDPLLYYIPPCFFSCSESNSCDTVQFVCWGTKISMLLFVVPCKCLTNHSNICGNSIFYTDVETSV